MIYVHPVSGTTGGAFTRYGSHVYSLAPLEIAGINQANQDNGDTGEHNTESLSKTRTTICDAVSPSKEVTANQRGERCSVISEQGDS